MKKAKESKVIKRALHVYWSCKVCRVLGWDGTCKDKEQCGENLYKLLKEHFEQKEE